LKKRAAQSHLSRRIPELPSGDGIFLGAVDAEQFV
jgi:hypothetical protein